MLYKKKVLSGKFDSIKLVGKKLKVIDKEILFNKECVYFLISFKDMSIFEYRTKKNIDVNEMDTVCISKEVIFCPCGVRSGTNFQLYGDEIYKIK